MGTLVSFSPGFNRYSRCPKKRNSGCIAREILAGSSIISIYRFAILGGGVHGYVTRGRICSYLIYWKLIRFA